MIRIEDTPTSKYGLNYAGETIEQVLGIPEFLVDLIVEGIKAEGALDALDALPVGTYRTKEQGHVWVKNEDGTWTDGEGNTNPVAWNFILAGTRFRENIEPVEATD